MVRYLNGGEKQASRRLWEQAFPGDSKAFCDYYYQEKIRDNRIIVDEEKGRIVSVAHLNPYEIKIGGSLYFLDYIVGVATEEGERHKGHMRRLLLRLLKDMHWSGRPFCFLMPASPDIYRPFQFEYIFDQPLWKLRADCPLEIRAYDLNGAHCRKRPQDCGQNLAAVARWMDEWMEKRYEIYAVRSRSYVERLWKEMESEDGRVKLLYDGDRLTGIEGEWGIGQREQRFLYCDPKFTVEKGTHPAIMARITNVKAIMETVRLARGTEEGVLEVPVMIEDALIPENCGLWQWSVGAGRTEVKRLADSCAGTGEQRTLTLTISQLAQWIFGYAGLDRLIKPDQLPDWWRLVRPFQGVFLDEIV